MKKIYAVVLSALLSLSLAGCQQPEASTQKGPADSSLCANTSAYLMAETEGGFYYSTGNILYYADQENLTEWVPVCSRPDCSHNGPDCQAYLANDGRFVLKGEQIYFCDSNTRYHPDGDSGTVLASMTLDGGDRKVAYTIPGSLSDAGGSDRFCLLGDQLIAMYCRMNEGGAFDTRMVRVDETGEQELFTGTMEQLPSWLGAVTRYEDMGGDTALYFYLDDSQENWACTLYRPTAEGLEKLGDVSGLGNLMDLDFTGSYLSGEVLRIYRPGDGYYDVNLATGQETKALDSQLEDAWGWQLTERYAVESTLLSRPLAHQKATVDREQAMTLYDGERWRPVALPEELARGPLFQNLRPVAVTSEGIFFQAKLQDQRRLYQVKLDGDTLQMTFLFAFPA